MTNVMVSKRDGSIEEFKVDKVRQCINWACEGLQVNPLALESRFNEYLQSEVTSKTIQDNLIYCARSLAAAYQPDWNFVAGRLYTMNIWKESGAYDKDFYTYLTDGEVKYNITSTVFPKYTKEDIEELGAYIKKDRDLSHSYGSVLTAHQKYLMEGECIQLMFMLEAMIIAGVEDTGRVGKAKEMYDAMSQRKLSMATPWLTNLRTNGNISSCFIIKVGDDITSIFDNVSRAAHTSKSGGGMGIDLSSIRAQGSEVNGNPNASKGVFYWAKIFNDVAVAVDQGGKRAGAVTISLPIWHRDIEGFLEIQHETGDLRTRCFDIFPQVTMHDYFMELDEKDAKSEWHTFCPYEVLKVLGIDLPSLFGKEFKKAYKQCVSAHHKGQLKNVKVYTTRNLIKIMMRTQFESGLPYVAFIDTINDDNPNDHEGTIPCVNLCNESFSVVKADEYAHSCNLISIVAGRCEDYEEVEYLARLATRMLDNGIALTTDPMKIAGAHNERYRTIGIGIQGLHDWLAKNDKFYNDSAFIGEFAETVQYGAVKESILLAEERGAYPAFIGSRWHNGKQIKKYKNNSRRKLDWDSLQDAIDVCGIRNSQLTSPAPNTSSSIFMDAGAGVMPCYADFYLKDNVNGEFAVAGMFLKEKPLFYSKNAAMYDHKILVEAVAEIQKFTDAGISSEYIFDHNKENFSAKLLYDLIHFAWKKKTKAVYYIRNVKKGTSLLSTIGASEADCDSCSN